MELGVRAKIHSTAKLWWTCDTEILICVEGQWEGQRVRVGIFFCTVRHDDIFITICLGL